MSQPNSYPQPTTPAGRGRKFNLDVPKPVALVALTLWCLVFASLTLGSATAPSGPVWFGVVLFGLGLLIGVKSMVTTIRKPKR